MAVIITAVASGPITTAKRSTRSAVHSFWEVAHHLGGLVHQAVCAEEVLAPTGVAVPVLCTVEQVGIVAWLPSLAYICRVMVVWSTVSIAVLVLVRYAVLIAVVANQPIAAVHSQVPVAHHSFNIVLEILGAIALVLVLRTHHVLAMAPSTMPVLPAVVLVGVVAIRQFRAIEGWLVRATGWCRFTRLAILVAHSADWPIATIS